MHSLAYGIPVITNRYEYHGPEFDNLTDENSIVYENHNELGNILIKITQNKLSIELGKNAYELYSKYRTIDYMVQGFKNAIEYTTKDNK